MASHPDPRRSARQDVTFQSQGLACHGWLSYPTGTQAGAADPVPLVVMAHGFAGTRELRLEAYAERFNAAGMATLIFDYRYFGDSEGLPRQLMVPSRQIQDWHAALAFARELPGIDNRRIALWGTSFAGGLVITVAAQDGHVAATVSQCPMLDALPRSPVWRDTVAWRTCCAWPRMACWMQCAPAWGRHRITFPRWRLPAMWVP